MWNEGYHLTCQVSVGDNEGVGVLEKGYSPHTSTERIKEVELWPINERGHT